MSHPDSMMRTLFHRENARPPVLQDRSAGFADTVADSPLIAESSTEATPSCTSPSPGMKLGRGDTTSLRARSFRTDHHLYTEPSLRKTMGLRFGSGFVQRVRLAPFHASAMARRGLANLTVNQAKA